MKSSAVLVLATAASTVSAWGALGHQSVALIAQQYLLPKTITKVQKLLDDTSTMYLANVASWADSYRNEPAGKFSAPLHFVNGHDAPPPDSCKISYPTDCPPEGCIVGAIANYTTRLMSNKYSVGEHQQALKFLVHFLGDIAQPLHTEAFGGGANNLTVFFDGYRTNLHAAWDTSIPNAILGLTPTASITPADSLGWANNLAARINSGDYKQEVSRWLKNHSVSSKADQEKAAAAWASDGNLEVCDVAIIKPGDKLNGTEVAGAYYRKVKPTVEMSIAKGGVRLAGWLNLIFDGTTGFDKK